MNIQWGNMTSQGGQRTLPVQAKNGWRTEGLRKTKLAKGRRGEHLQQREEHVTKAMVCLGG